ncbi:cytochrome c oxidase assembly protein [Dictyobacter kobayashii]|uniref:Cytochrome c oxidase assembly protein n=1 Tax=Dictyobacter kobayashii TaxID=2014872 RepID=A0A402AMZ7_9CHLR|nr:cytochrome c oxidase assembly protein [Dictyobacter kobayashii]GCE20507.1 hypothetical protein KDK_43070 [Dictyobacter kobayashii]
MLSGLSLAWSWSPGGLLCFIILALLYLLRLRQVYILRQRDPQAPTVSKIRVASFFIGLLLFAALFFSPVHTIGRTQLFSVHMAEVVVLTTLCAPLLLGGCSEVILRPILEIPVVSTVVRFLTNPIVTSIIFNASFLLWHAPKIYNAAMPNVSLYNTMMLCIFLTSLLNWWPVIGSLSELKKHGYPLQMLYVILDGQPVDIFAFILVYSGVPLYTLYRIPVQTGLNAFGDQAAAGALLLLPGLIDLVVLSPLFISWMGQIEHKTRAADLRRLAEAEAMDYDEEDEDVGIEAI